MDAPAVLYALRWLIHDTFRQTLTSRVFWILLGLSGLCIVFCLGVSVEGGAVREGKEFFTPEGNVLAAPNVESGRMNLLFGLFPVSFSRTPDEPVQLVLIYFASWVAGLAGILVALVFTAGFVPESLQPSAAAVLLAKPAPRWLILAGKFLGVVAFVTLHATIFFVGTWLALGLRTEAWKHAEYLLGIPLAVLHFTTVFSFSILIATLTRNTTACVVSSVLFWVVCGLINMGRHFAVSYSVLNPGQELPGFTVFLAELGYWLMPKPIDLIMLLEQSLRFDAVKQGFSDTEPIKTVLAQEMFHPLGVLLTSCVFPVFALWASASQLAKTDY
ncbi:MAG: ABC transporter permease subunit [Planctomycetes bacterium]|jgi:ABC-type transport system involved in multi-copper enzyme maturation permease subunit|nr:ABC transporter permease subunit [Planctomycetota bacterium]